MSDVLQHYANTAHSLPLPTTPDHNDANLDSMSTMSGYDSDATSEGSAAEPIPSGGYHTIDGLAPNGTNEFITITTNAVVERRPNPDHLRAAREYRFRYCRRNHLTGCSCRGRTVRLPSQRLEAATLPVFSAASGEEHHLVSGPIRVLTVTLDAETGNHHGTFNMMRLPGVHGSEDRIFRSFYIVNREESMGMPLTEVGTSGGLRGNGGQQRRTQAASWNAGLGSVRPGDRFPGLWARYLQENVTSRGVEQRGVRVRETASRRELDEARISRRSLVPLERQAAPVTPAVLRNLETQRSLLNLR